MRPVFICKPRHDFRKITAAAGLGTVDHKGTTTTETVYRKVIVPELRRGAEVMDRLFS
jgi:hypothetical protein